MPKTGGFGSRYNGTDTTPVRRGKSGGFGSRYNSGPAAVNARPRKKDTGHHGPLGLLENLGGDVVGAIAGIPAGIVHTVEHPVGTAKGIAKSYAQTYGPLLHGDVAKFAHNLYSHPLGPILDAATIITLGGAGSVRAADMLAEAGAISKAGRLAQLGKAERLAVRSPKEFAAGQEGTLGRMASRNPVIRARQQAIHRLMNQLPYETPHIGEAARYGREAHLLPRQQMLRLTRGPEARAYNRAVRNLSNEEFAALHLIGNDLHPLDYRDALVKLQHEGGKVDPTMLKVLENPKVREHFENPDARMMKAVDAAEALTKHDAALKIEHGILSEETAAARVGKHRPAAEELLGELRPTPGRRFYVPDVPTARRIGNPELAKMGAGGSVPKNIVRQNRGVLFRTGQLALTPDLLGREYLRTVKYGLADDLHATMMSGAARLSTEEARAGHMPKGWEFVPKEVISKTGAKRAQAIHPLIRQKAGAVRAQEELLPSEQRILDSFKAADIRDAATLHGDYLIVPSALKRELVGEFHRSSSAVRQFLDKPFKVWRSLVLGFRVGFLVNNMVGNHLLYALHAAGVDGLRAYLNAIKREKGAKVVRSLLEDKQLPPALRERFMEEFFPEQGAGATFGETQKVGPGRLLSGKKGRRVRAAAVGLAPATQALAETGLRRGLVETFIRRSPEFRRAYREMPRETRDFEAAAKKILLGDGGTDFQRQISHKVDNALGNYLNMNPFEKNVIRSVIPFYSWYRAITRITAHLALDTPGRANILAKLGQVGEEETRQRLGELPDFLAGLIPAGATHDGHHAVITTRGYNPFTTVTDIGQGLTGLIAGRPGEAGKAFTQLGPNPFLLGAIENLAGKDLFTGRDISTGGRFALPGLAFRDIGTQLPQAQLLAALRGHGRESKLYGKQSGREALLAFLGAPVKQLDLERAHGYARNPP